MGLKTNTTMWILVLLLTGLAGCGGSDDKTEGEDTNSQEDTIFWGQDQTGTDQTSPDLITEDLEEDKLSPDANSCGDGDCNGEETCETCAGDCGECPIEGCGDGECAGEEDCQSCPGDCGQCPAQCGDTDCNGDETCDSCPDDCGECPDSCGDQTCQPDLNETCQICPQDCGECPPECGDGECNGDEDCDTCLTDCGQCPPECGDEECNGDESCTSCPDDCGECPVTCGDGECHEYDNEDCHICPEDCGACPPECGDGECNGAETCEDCYLDCGLCPAECGNGQCETAQGENCELCLQDCGACPPECGDDICEGNETCLGCPDDCGDCPNPCGDEECDSDGGETCSTCPDDCGACAACGDETCDESEACGTCPEDCGACPPECDDDDCNGDETCESCPEDCGNCIPECGDEVCSGDETCSTCPQDCGECAPECGDEQCNGQETCEDCPVDCGECPVSCGNEVCEDDESCDTCVADCGACPVTINFNGDYTEQIGGPIISGEPLRIDYDHTRLPTCRGLDEDENPAWDLVVFYTFDLSADAQQVSVVNVSSQTGEVTNRKPIINIPEDAENIWFWTNNLDSSGCSEWDSDFGLNYMYPVFTQETVSQDISWAGNFQFVWLANGEASFLGDVDPAYYHASLAGAEVANWVQAEVYVPGITERTYQNDDVERQIADLVLLASVNTNAFSADLGGGPDAALSMSKLSYVGKAGNNFVYKWVPASLTWNLGGAPLPDGAYEYFLNFIMKGSSTPSLIGKPDAPEQARTMVLSQDLECSLFPYNPPETCNR
jgi:Family of unknown function (DUF6209)